jgi:hypothetical protein
LNPRGSDATFVLSPQLTEYNIKYIFVNGVSEVIFDAFRIEPEYNSRKTNKRDDTAASLKPMTTIFF